MNIPDRQSSSAVLLEEKASCPQENAVAESNEIIEMWQDDEIGVRVGGGDGADNPCSPLVRTPLVGPGSNHCEHCERCEHSQQCRDNCGAPALVFKCALAAVALAAVILLAASTGTGHPQTASSSATAASATDTVGGSGGVGIGTGGRSFVCITGQLERLELENKIATVLEPLRSAGYEPDIALLLDDTSSFVTNDQRVQVDFIPPFDTYGDAADHLRDRDFNVLTDGPYRQADSPVINDDYVRLLHKHASMSDEKHLERAKNNIRMLESWSRCYHEMSKDLSRVGSYNLAVRIREDTGFLEALDVPNIVNKLRAEPKTIISNGCRFGGGGMNDKFAILSMDAAQTYFVEPFRYLYTKPINSSVKSSETFIYYTYREEGMNVVHSDSIRHIVKLAADERGRTVLYRQERKKLEKSCGIAVASTEEDDDDEPSACTATWDAKRHLLEPAASQVCWPYSYTDP